MGNVKQGEIYLYNFGEKKGSVQCGVRPVVVIQDDKFNKTSTTTIVAAITTAVKKDYLSSHIVVGKNFGLDKPSMVLLEQVKTINQSELDKYVGVIDDIALKEKLRRGLNKAFGVKKQESKYKIISLCDCCLHEEMQDKKIIIRRLDPFTRQKERCSKCCNLGFKYIEYRK